MDHEFKPKHPRDVLRHGLLGLRCGHAGMSSEISEEILSWSKFQWCLRQGKCTMAYFPYTKFLQWYIKNEAFSIRTNYKENGTFLWSKIILNMCNIWHFVCLNKYMKFCFSLKKYMSFCLFTSSLGIQIIHSPKSY